jgi:hypothetical protein
MLSVMQNGASTNGMFSGSERLEQNFTEIVVQLLRQMTAGDVVQPRFEIDSSLWVITRRVVLIGRRFGPPCWFKLCITPEDGTNKVYRNVGQ